MHYNLAASPHAHRLKTFNLIERPLMPAPNESGVNKACDRWDHANKMW